MLIVCPTCATSYDVELETLSPEGRKVRCLRCRAVWHAAPSRADKLVAAAAALALEPDPAEMMAPVRAAREVATGEPPVEHSVEAPLEQASPSGEAANAANAPADEEVVAVDAPPTAPVDPDTNGPPIEITAEKSTGDAVGPTEDIETVAARRQRRSRKRRAMRWPLSRPQTAIMALALISVVLVGWRSDVVRLLPQTASFYALLGLPVNLRGLTFEDVATAVEQHDGVPILVIEGNIVNRTRKDEEVPRLKLVVRNAAHQEIYSWTAVPSRSALQPGETTSFRARLASPPPETHDLILRFLNHRDIVAGMR
jgi:predicted Zn finger-like uncharacterized protein